MADQLSSDLASLRIARDEAPPSSIGRTLVVIAIVLVAAAAAWIFGYPYVRANFLKPVVELTAVVLVSPADAEVELTSTGYVVPQRTSRVGAKIAGRIAIMHVEQGDTVEAGQVIAELDAHDTEAALRTARSRVAVARADVATAKAELTEARQKAVRERKLVARNVAAEETAIDLEARVAALQKRVEAAAATVKAAQAEVDALAVNLGYLEITAPISGTVVNKPATAGELVGTMAATIVELADFESLMVETDVPEARLHLVEMGGPAEIALDAFPGDRYRGKVEEIVPHVDRAKATITVKVAFVDRAARALPDMSARVSFLSKALRPEDMKQPAKLVVPAAAIAERGGAKVVFVLEGGVIRADPVTLGPAVGNGFELLDGPPAGTKVVREPAAALEDGQEVKEEGAT